MALSQVVLEAISIAIQAAVIFLLLRSSSFRKYPLLLVYCVLQLAATVTEEYVYRVHGQTNLFRRLYWTDEVTLDLLLFLMVITLIYRAVEGSSVRTAMGRLLGAIVVLVLVVPFVLFSARRFSTTWFDGTSQLLNFGAAIMNLGLWTALIGTKKRDPLLLTVSAGLGVAVTGAAIAYGLRRFTPPTSTPQQLANLFKTLTYLASVAIWCWAFRPAARKSHAPPAAVNSPSVPS
ncbi:MAG TPA: hypothetical protein VE958_04680 [Bryobacteraceae bacterium]|jgi:hypothetical protein|nr:hypothetical protein [Bryobacteraceae bacterium]